MKILFGLNNDDTVKAIVKYYEETFKEKVEYKNVYYFKQAIQEIKGGEYDRLVILENLEKYPTNNYAQIDDFIFHNIDAMTDEFDAKNIIFIASDRRNLGDEFLAKLFKAPWVINGSLSLLIHTISLATVLATDSSFIKKSLLILSTYGTFPT